MAEYAYFYECWSKSENHFSRGERRADEFVASARNWLEPTYRLRTHLQCCDLTEVAAVLRSEVKTAGNWPTPKFSRSTSVDTSWGVTCSSRCNEEKS